MGGPMKSTSFSWWISQRPSAATRNHDNARMSEPSAAKPSASGARPRRTARELSARSPSKKRRPEAIHRRREHQTPPSRLAKTRETLLAPRHFHDLFPDIRRQAVPARDKLAQSQIRACQVRTGVRGVSPIALLDNDWSISGRGCNSRRLHFMIPNLLCHINLRLRKTRVCFPPPQFPDATHYRRGPTESLPHYPFAMIHSFGSRVILHRLRDK
jgi:hypothetical protein